MLAHDEGNGDGAGVIGGFTMGGGVTDSEAAVRNPVEYNALHAASTSAHRFPAALPGHHEAVRPGFHPKQHQIVSRISCHSAYARYYRTKPM